MMEGWKDEGDVGSFFKSGHLEITILRNNSEGWFFVMYYGPPNSDDKVTIFRPLVSSYLEDAKKETLREISAFSLEMTDDIEKFIERVAGTKVTIPANSQEACPNCSTVVEPRMFDPTNKALWFLCKECDHKWKSSIKDVDVNINKSNFPLEMHEGPYQDPRCFSSDWNKFESSYREITSSFDNILNKLVKESRAYSKKIEKNGKFPTAKILSNLNKIIGNVEIKEDNGGLWVVGKVDHS